MQERRKLTRTRVLKSAKFLLGKSSVIDCVVRDLTNAGACVELPSTIDLPEALDLTFNGGLSVSGIGEATNLVREASGL